MRCVPAIAVRICVYCVYRDDIAYIWCVVVVVRSAPHTTSLNIKKISKNIKYTVCSIQQPHGKVCERAFLVPCGDIARPSLLRDSALPRQHVLV